MSKFIAIDTNPWKLDDLYACVLLKAFDAPGCGVIVVTDNPDTLANATWVINSKVFNVLNAKFAEELEIDPIPVDNINTSQRLWNTYGRGYLTRKAQQLDPLCSERTRTETVDYVYTQINKFFEEMMHSYELAKFNRLSLINSTEYMALLYHGVRDDQRKMEKLFNNLVIDRLSFFNTYVNEMFRKYKEINIVKQSVNSSRNDAPVLVNTDTQELIDGVRVEFVHKNKFMTVVHGELENVKVFAKNHFK